MNCPRCKTPIGPLANPDSIVTCPGCGSRLMTRSAALRSQGAPKANPEGASPGILSPSVAPPAFPAVPVSVPPKPAAEPPNAVPAASSPPSATLPPTPAAALGLGKDTARTKGKPDDDEARPASRKRKGDEATLETLLGEVRAIRETQQLVLEALDALRRARPVPAATAGGEEEGPSLSPIRARRQKTVILVDDDPQTREAAVAELLRANVPVRAFAEGNAALGGIAAEKPDVIALEIGLGGDMGGRDLVNMIKATMEWVDIPIILWTREGVATQKEARQIHGADEVVQKLAGPAALVARVITVFRSR
ncbi:MAG TPA: response regulator [Vicinamibacteria bacterium]